MDAIPGSTSYRSPTLLRAFPSRPGAPPKFDKSMPRLTLVINILLSLGIMFGFGLAAFGWAGWMACLAVSGVWAVLGWAFLLTKRSADR